MGFDGFISYSHAADGRLAPSLQRGLQRMAKPWYRKRALRVFRDESALSANPHLWSSIRDALDTSEWFVLLASPSSADSEWVQRELGHWLEHKAAERIMLVVTDGICAWEPHDRRLSGTAVPALLSEAFSEEPRFVDLRWASAESDLSLGNPRFRDAVAELGAPMHGVGKDDLEGAEIREHRRAIRTAQAVAGALALLALAAVTTGLLALRNAHAARASERRANDAKSDEAFQLVVSRSHDLRDYQPDVALLLAVEARRMRDDARGRGALEAVLAQEPRFRGFIFDPARPSGFTSACLLANDTTAVAGTRDGFLRFFDLRKSATIGSPLRPQSSVPVQRGVTCATSADRRVLVAANLDSGEVFLVDPQSHSVLAKPSTTHQPARQVNDVAVSPDGRLAATGDRQNGEVRIWAIGKSLILRRTVASGEQRVALAFSPDGRTLATTSTDSTGASIVLWDTRTWAIRSRIPIEDTEAAGCACDVRSSDAGDDTLRPSSVGPRAEFSADGNTIVVSGPYLIQSYDVASGAARWTIRNAYFSDMAFAFSPDGSRVIAQPNGDEIRIYDARRGTQVGAPIASHIGNAQLVVTQSGRVVAAPRSRPALASWSLDEPTGATRGVGKRGDVPTAYSADGTKLLIEHRTVSGGLFEPSVVLDERTGTTQRLPRSAFDLFTDDSHVGAFFTDVLGFSEFDLQKARLLNERVPVCELEPRAAPRCVDYNAVIAYDFDPVTHEALITSKGDVLVYSLTKRPTQRFPHLGGYLYSLSHGGDRLAVSERDSGKVFILDVRTGEPLIAPIANLRFGTLSADGTELAGFVAGGARVQIFDAGTGKPIGAPMNVPAGASRLAFGDRNSILAVSAAESTTLYDLASRQVLGDPFTTTDYAQLRPDGRELAIPNQGGVVLWSLDADNWTRTACQLAGRNLTRDEWREYIGDAGSYRATCPQWPAAP